MTSGRVKCLFTGIALLLATWVVPQDNSSKPKNDASAKKVAVSRVDSVNAIASAGIGRPLDPFHLPITRIDLLFIPPVVKHLELEPSQIEKLWQVRYDAIDARFELYKSYNSQVANPKQNPKDTEMDLAQISRLILQDENDRIDRVVNASQRIKLDQIRFQVEVQTAKLKHFTRPDMVQHFEITSQQKLEIAKVQKEFEMEFMRKTGQLHRDLLDQKLKECFTPKQQEKYQERSGQTFDSIFDWIEGE